RRWRTRRRAARTYERWPDSRTSAWAVKTPHGAHGGRRIERCFHRPHPFGRSPLQIPTDEGPIDAVFVVRLAKACLQLRRDRIARFGSTLPGRVILGWIGGECWHVVECTPAPANAHGFRRW